MQGMTPRSLSTSARVATAGMAALLAGCAATPPTPPTSADVVGEFRKGSGYVNGYLDRKQLPDSLALLSRPPAPGSAAAASDLETHRATRALRGTPRWNMAAQDAVLKFPAAASTFSCALGVPVSEAATPHLNMLLRRVLLDSGLATYAAKDTYKRVRPFAELGEGTCAPDEEKNLAKDGSYPSGHAAVGWAWALVLTQIAPERSQALLNRGMAFGHSRVVCGVHWSSDVTAGQAVGAAAVARLQSNATFQAQAALARDEIGAARAAGRQPAAGVCSAEAAALAQR